MERANRDNSGHEYSPVSALDLGQPFGGIVQAAYTVEDIESAILAYSSRIKIGPWFVRGPFVPEHAEYRGEKTDLTITLAMAFSGHLMIELIQQHDDLPSVYSEIIGRRGYGFHHWGIASQHFDDEAEEYRKLGYELVFSDLTPLGTRIAYFDTTRDLPGMVELIEVNERQDHRYSRMYGASLGWDGCDPIRRI